MYIVCARVCECVFALVCEYVSICVCVSVCTQVHGHTHAHLARTRVCAPHCACAGDAYATHARARVGRVADHYIGL